MLKAIQNDLSFVTSFMCVDANAKKIEFVPYARNAAQHIEHRQFLCQLKPYLIIVTFVALK